MKKNLKRILICTCAAVLCWTIGVLRDRETLNRELIRLHVVADSDSEHDQSVKLSVRDAVLESIREGLSQATDIDQARQYIRDNLPKIEQSANEVLKSLGCDEQAVATLKKEVFDTRHYDTFSLPAGVYEALRITIGTGEGRNWWCVAFPTLCVPATAAEFRDVAAGAGFDDALTSSLQADAPYEIRFYLLDLLGKLEARFFKE